MLPKYPRVMMAAVVVVWSGPIYSPQLKGSLDPDTSAATNQFEPRVSEEQIPELIAAITRAEASVINNRDNAAEQSLWKTYADLNHRTNPQVLELVRQKPKTEEAFTGLKWIVTNRQVTAGGPSSFGVWEISDGVVAFPSQHAPTDCRSFSCRGGRMDHGPPTHFYTAQNGGR